MQQAQRNQAVAAVAKTNEIEEPPVSFRSIEDLQQSGINVRYYIYIYQIYQIISSLMFLYLIVALCMVLIIDRLVT